MSQNSLSLFEAAEVVSKDATSNEVAPKETSRVGHSDTHDRQQRHLQAARRLSRRIARLPDHSPEQLRAGQMICRHLVAMLEEAAAETELTPH